MNASEYLEDSVGDSDWAGDRYLFLLGRNKWPTYRYRNDIDKLNSL